MDSLLTASQSKIYMLIFAQKIRGKFDLFLY